LRSKGKKGLANDQGNPVTFISPETKVISVTPSLDTPVCDVQATRFNEEAEKLPDDIVVLKISMDLSFAISRFCTTKGVDKVKAFSDHKDAFFGTSHGVLIKELRLLARSIFIIGKDDRIRYIEIVPEKHIIPIMIRRWRR